MTDTFASLRVPDYRRLWIAGLCSFGAVPMQGIARGFLAFDLTGKNSALGLTLLGMGVPMLLLTPVGGVAADRFGKRSVMIFATGLLWLSAVSVLAMLLTDRLEFWMLVVSSVFQGAAFALIAPTRMAFSAELVGRDRLSNAILLAQVSMNGTRVLGPSIAGALLGIATLGADAVYVVVATLLTIGIWLTWRLPPGLPAADRAPSSPFGDMTEGLRYVRAHPNVLWPVLMGIVVVATAFPYVAFLPSLVDDVFSSGPGWLGALSAAGAVGAVVSSLLIARAGTEHLADHAVFVVALLFGGTVVALGVAPAIGWALVVVFLAGAANAAFQALNNSLVLLRAEDEYHGRVQSLLMFGFSAFGIFAAPLGALADAIGLRQTLVLMGATSIVMVGVLHAFVVRSRRAGAAPVAAPAVPGAVGGGS
ncbi:MAG: MFS transporter [Ilumatobacter sp.]|uniref:MFS transporter n=1 Tax=Ilumatobacter sp. TaxID=1967498 RepID=UPI00262527AE|nr:MFS transporter [Ilumatobacter sp.]MDJ0769989.1 MFS transporter [Ilumatobacter sp.]